MKRKYPIVTPDTLRKFLHTNKAFFDTYVKKNNGYVDTNGSVYNGTVNNFGGELLLESRKLFLNKPNIDKINVSSEFLYYFDIKYAGDVSTYEQQNLIICTLKENVFTDNHTWRLKFPCDSRPRKMPLPYTNKNNIDLGIVHSLSKSDNIICREAFFQTDKDVIIVKDGVEIPLKFSEYGNNTIYARPWNCGKEYLFGISDPEIDTNVIGDITHDLTDSEWRNQVMFYIHNDALDMCTYEPISARSYDDFPLLRYGSNGHDNSFVFPGMEPGSNISVGNVPEELYGEWFIELIPAPGYSFTIPTNVSDKSNDYVVIDKVIYHRMDSYDAIPEVSYDYELPSEYVHHFPNNNIIGYMHDGKMYTTRSYSTEITPDNCHIYYDQGNSKYYVWNCEEYVETEYGGIQYYTDDNDVVHAYASFNNYKQNYVNDTNTKSSMIALLKTEYQPSTLYNYEYLKGNAVTGIHINSTSMHSDNGIIQKNGITHNMCDFDGLPDWYHNFYNDRNVCISRSIIYAIHDAFNHDNQSAMDKPTAALIVDSGYPITQAKHVYDMDSDIHYVDPYSYVGDGDYNSSVNYLSDIAYVDDTTFADTSVTGEKVKYRFVYHGNYFFSTDVMDFDPDMNYGRIYYVNNDSANFVSNIDGHIPGRSLARICDIPTSFTQLQHITNYAPTYVVDVKYNRTKAPYTETEQSNVWNNYVPEWIRCDEGVVFPKFYNVFEMNRDYLYSGNIHSIYDNLNSYITIPTSDHSVIVNEGGTGYSTGDTFTFEVGGQTITGTIDEVNNGQVLSIVIDNEYSIHYSFLSLATTFETATISGSGSGLTVDVNVPDYESYLRSFSGYPDDMFALMYDGIDNIWIYNVSTTAFDKLYKLTGVNYPDNPYVSSIDIINMENAFINELFNKNIFIDNSYLDKYNNDVMIIPTHSHSPSISTDILPLDIDITKPDDLSSYLEEMHQNEQNSMFFIYKETFEEYYRAEKIIAYKDSDLNSVPLPKNHQLNLSSYSNIMCSFSYAGRDKSQMDICIFNPNKRTLTGYEWASSGTYYRHSIPNAPNVIVDSLQNPAISELLHDDSYVTRGNIYMSSNGYYNGWADTLKSQLEQMTRDELLQYIKEHFKNEYCEPLEVERCYIETIDQDVPLYRYTKEDLITYILQNSVDDLNKVDGVHLVQTINTRMNSDEYHAIGDFQLLDITAIDDSLKINSSEVVLNNICYVFRFESLIANFRDFRMYDADGNDISDKCLLIYDNRAWYWYNNTWNNL